MCVNEQWECILISSWNFAEGNQARITPKENQIPAERAGTVAVKH